MHPQRGHRSPRALNHLAIEQGALVGMDPGSKPHCGDRSGLDRYFGAKSCASAMVMFRMRLRVLLFDHVGVDKGTEIPHAIAGQLFDDGTAGARTAYDAYLELTHRCS